MPLFSSNTQTTWAMTYRLSRSSLGRKFAESIKCQTKALFFLSRLTDCMRWTWNWFFNKKSLKTMIEWEWKVFGVCTACEWGNLSDSEAFQLIEENNHKMKSATCVWADFSWIIQRFPCILSFLFQEMSKLSENKYLWRNDEHQITLKVLRPFYPSTCDTLQHHIIFYEKSRERKRGNSRGWKQSSENRQKQYQRHFICTRNRWKLLAATYLDAGDPSRKRKKRETT